MSCRAGASGVPAENLQPRTSPLGPGAAGTSAKVLGLCGVTVSLRNLPPAPNKTRRGGDLTSLAPHKMLPELPALPRGKESAQGCLPKRLLGRPD